MAQRAAVALGNPNYTCSNIGTPNVLSLGIFDGGFNFMICAININVIDEIAPIATCMDATISLDGNGMAAVDVNTVDNGSTDNCALASSSVSPSTFDCSNIGANTVTLTIMDAGGQSSTCTASVQIVDDSTPNPSYCGDTFQVDLDNTGAGSFDISMLPAVLDNCGGALSVFPLGAATYGCANLGNNILPLGIADASGNFMICNVTVAVADPLGLCSTPMMAVPTTTTEAATAATNLEERQGAATLLSANAYPNPFSTTARIDYNLSVPAHTLIEVYDATGQRVDQLLDRVISSGNHRAFWTQEGVSNGVYFVRIQVEHEPAQMLRIQYLK